MTTAEANPQTTTLEQLLPLARAYGVTLDELVDAPPTGNPRINLRPISCSDGSTILPLTRRPGGIQAYKFVLLTGNDDAGPVEDLSLIGKQVERAHVRAAPKLRLCE